MQPPDILMDIQGIGGRGGELRLVPCHDGQKQETFEGLTRRERYVGGRQEGVCARVCVSKNCTVVAGDDEGGWVFLRQQQSSWTNAFRRLNVDHRR